MSMLILHGLRKSNAIADLCFANNDVPERARFVPTWLVGVVGQVPCSNERLYCMERPLCAFESLHRRAQAGERLTVAFMGGSLTWGARASDPQRTSYRALIGRYLDESYPQAHFTFVDAAIGGSGSQLAVFRLQRDVLAYHPDLVFLDFTLNDDIYHTTPDTLAAYESLVRRLIGEGHCPVVQMILAARQFVAEPTMSGMLRRDAHLAISRAYNTAVGDAVALLREKYSRGEIDLDHIWPPEAFDNTHPDDPGYALFATAGWNAFQSAIQNGVACRLPEKMIHADTYLRWARVRLSSLTPLPEGWHVANPQRVSVAFDFYMSRWLDDVTVAANFIERGRDQRVPAEPARPLRVRFSGTMVLFFGESTLTSCRYRVLLDGAPAPSHGQGLPGGEYDAAALAQACRGNAHLWTVIAEGLDAAKEHTLEIQPLFEGADKPGELRLESICVAGGQARVWRVQE